MVGLNRRIGVAAAQGGGGLQFSQTSYPALTTANLTSPSGLTAGSNGGVVASVAPFAIFLRIRVSSDTTNKVTIHLQNDNGDTDWWAGVSVGDFTANKISAGAGVTILLNNIGGAGTAPDGTYFCLAIIGDGARVTLSLIPDIAASSMTAGKISQTPPFQAAYNQINYKSDPITNVGGGAGNYTWGQTGVPAGQLSKIKFTNSSSTIEIMGAHLCIGAIRGPSTAAMPAPAILELSHDQDSTGASAAAPTILLPKFHGPNGAPFVFSFQPSGNPGQLGQSNSMATVMALWEGGYAVGTTTGAQNASEYAGATSSHWGAPVGLAYRFGFVEKAYRYIPRLGKKYGLAMSMGTQTAFAYQRYYGGLAALAVVSGAFDLTDSYNSRGFSTVINNGFGAWYQALQSSTGNDPASSPTYFTPIATGLAAINTSLLASPANWRSGTAYGAGTAYATDDVTFKAFTGGIAALSDYDPVLNPTRFTALPVKAWHGTSDATIPDTQMTSFATAVNGAGGSVTTVSVASGTHLGATMYDSAAIKTFFDAH
jgi:hypothetical protein